MLERSHGPIKESLKAALLDNAEFHQSKWIDHLPWVILGKNSAYQPDIKASAFQMLYGFSPVLPGQILNPNDEHESVQQLQELLECQQKRVAQPAIQPSSHNQIKQYPELTTNSTHVYTKQHKALGLQPGFAGPFPIVQWVSRSTVKIQVGRKANGEPTFEIRHLNDLKFAHPDSHTADALRPSRGRPKKSNATTAVPDDSTPAVPNEVNIPKINTIDFSKPPPHLQAWSASGEDLHDLNTSINSKIK